MDQAFLARQDLDERAERQDPSDFAGVDLTRLDLARDLAHVDLACFDLARQRADPIDGFLGVFGVVGTDVDRAIVLDVDAGLGLLGDLADDLAAWADDVADLVRVDLDGRNPRREAAHLSACLGDHRVHLVEDEQAALARLGERIPEDFLRQPGDFDVHLDRGHAFARASHLEVHVAERVFDALNVAQDGVLALGGAVFGDEAHRHAAHRRLERHARVEQRQRAAAGRSHGRGAVRAERVGHHADHVREVLLARQHCHECAFGQCAVADVAATDATQRSRLANAEGREVVVVDVALRLVEADRVDRLLVGLGAQGRHAEDLRLAAGE